jgi:hypothetical protein
MAAGDTTVGFTPTRPPSSCAVISQKRRADYWRPSSSGPTRRRPPHGVPRSRGRASWKRRPPPCVRGSARRGRRPSHGPTTSCRGRTRRWPSESMTTSRPSCARGSSSSSASGRPSGCSRRGGTGGADFKGSSQNSGEPLAWLLTKGGLREGCVKTAVVVLDICTARAYIAHMSRIVGSKEF